MTLSDTVLGDVFHLGPTHVLAADTHSFPRFPTAMQPCHVVRSTLTLVCVRAFRRIHLAERAAQDLCKRVGRPALEAMHSTLDARKTSKTRGAVAHGPIVAHQRAGDLL